MFHWAAPAEAFSVVGAPVAVIAGHQAASDEQNQVHKPPDAQASQGEQLPDGGACVAQAEAVDPKAAKEEGVQQRGDEVVSSVSARKQQQKEVQWASISETHLISEPAGFVQLLNTKGRWEKTLLWKHNKQPKKYEYASNHCPLVAMTGTTASVCIYRDVQNGLDFKSTSDLLIGFIRLEVTREQTQAVIKLLITQVSKYCWSPVIVVNQNGFNS